MGSSVFIELDAILDTRMAVVASLDPEAAAKLAARRDYYHRKNDDFSAITGIEHERYVEAYRNRTSSVLPDSVMTGIPRLLRRLIGDLQIESRTGPSDGPLEVELNLWPYEMTSLVSHRICDTIAIYCGHETPIKPVFYSPAELQPGYLKSRFGGVVLYNFNDWLVAQIEALRFVPIPQLTAIAPALFQGKVLTPEDTRPDPDSDSLDPFQVAESVLGTYLRVEFADTALFSMFGKPPEQAI